MQPSLGPLFEMRKIGRLLKWRLMSLRTGFGKIYVRPMDTDATTFRDVFVKRPYDLSSFPQGQRVLAAYRSLLAAGERPVIVDAGANVGAATRWFSLAWPDASIVAIEPDPAAANVCRKNASHLPNVRVVEAAVGSSSGQVQLIRSHGSQATRTERSGTAGVPIITISEAVELAGGRARLFIAKIDIEGFERDLFAANIDWVANAPVVFVESHDRLFPGQSVTRNVLKVFSATQHDVLITGGDTFAFVR